MKLRHTAILDRQIRKASKLMAIAGIFVVPAIILGTAFATSNNAQFSVSITNPEETIITAAGYFVSMMNSPEVNIEILPNPSGAWESAAQLIRVHTNAPTGYRLYLSSDQESDYAANKPGNGLYRNGDTSLEYLSPTVGSYNIDSASASLAALDTNSWGFSMTADASNDTIAAENTFAGVPLLNDKVLIKETNVADTSMDSTNTKFNIYYGAKVNTAIPSGVYTGKVVYSLMADAGNAQEASISPNKTNSITTATPVTITTSLFTNIEDLGEITAYIGTNGNAADACSNLTYNTDEALLVVSCDAPTRDLDVTTAYNVYVNVPKYDKTYTITDGFTYENDNKFWTITTMQEMTPDICAWATTPSASATTSDTTGAYQGNKSYVAQRTLSDIRDSNTYTVRKLADGNCWMVSNLGLGTYGESITLTPDDSDVSSNYIINSVNIINTNGQNWSNTPTDQHVYYRNSSLGNLYTWHTAVIQSPNTDDELLDSPYSICPKGWKLPSRESGKAGYSGLFGVYGTTLNTAKATPLSFVLSGAYTGGSLHYVNQQGLYWEAKQSASLYIYDKVHITSSSTYIGMSVRCVVR